jgi:hypothetical protein
MASAALCVLGVERVPFFGPGQSIATSYGLLIVAFMAGVHWRQALSGKNGAINLFVTSNTAALAAWFAFLLLPAAWFMARSFCYLQRSTASTACYIPKPISAVTICVSRGCDSNRLRKPYGACRAFCSSVNFANFDTTHVDQKLSKRRNTGVLT